MEETEETVDDSTMAKEFRGGGWVFEKVGDDYAVLLGVGPRGATYEPLTTLVRRVLGEIEVSCDSNALAANAGRTNGKGGGPRLLTELQDLAAESTSIAKCCPKSWKGSARAAAVWMAFGPMHLHGLVLAKMRADGHLPAVQVEPTQMDLFDRVSE